MAKKPIVWSARASFELQAILEFYNRRNGNTSYSLKLLNEIEKTLDILSENECIGKTVRDKKIRVLSLKHYSIIYENEDDKIKLHSFWGDRQNPSKSLK